MDKLEAQSLCFCPTCPTYFDCGEPLAFCFYEDERSSCIAVDQGCICPSCPVHEDEQFKLTLYCISGSEKARMG